MDIGLQTNWLDAQGTFPLTSVCHYTDHTQNRLNIWEVAQDKFFATVVSPEGRTTFLSMNRIINPLNKASPPLKTLQAIKAYPGDHWDLVYEPSRQEMIVWPHLRAAGKTSTEKAQAAASAYQQPSITDKADELGHIFRKSRGHFAQDTPENRTYILAAVSDPENKVTTTPHGIEVYLKIMEDGAQAWAYVVKGVVKNGGCNVFAQRWQEDLESPLGGNFVPLKYKLIDPSEFHLVIGIKLNNIMDVYMRSHPRKIIAPEKISQSVKGIEQCTGIISNLFDDPHALQRQEHAFFIPCEGALSLTQEEIQQLLCELARGIFLHDQVPFFSLHANFNLTHYPVVQPIYQGLIGYFLSMLDYYMKGLSANRFYSEEFILEWSKNPLIDEALFSKNSLKFSDYCGEEIYSLDEIIEQLTKKQATGGVSQERKIKNYQAGVTIVAKQNAIHYTDGLFILDGDFDLVPHLYPASPLPGEEAYHALLSNACDILCAQTKRVLTSLPFLKKHCEALSIINFFSYYFNTLKKAGQVPSLIHRFFPDNGKICPSIFPPYLKNATHPKRPQIRVLDLLEQMQVKQRLEVCAAIKNEQLTEGSIQYFAQALQEYATCFLAENNEFKDLSFCQQIAHILLSKCSLGHKAVHTSLGQGLVRLSFKKEGEPITEEVVRKYLIEVEDRLKESQELLRKQQDLILKSQDQAQLHLRKTDLLSIEKHREELLALQQTWSAWLQEPLKVSLEGIFAVFDFIQGSPPILIKQKKGIQAFSNGGINMLPGDKVAEFDPRAGQIKKEHDQLISDLPPQQVHYVHSEEGLTGILFKMEFESFSLDDQIEQGDTTSCFYAPNPRKPLTEVQFQALLAIVELDKAAFQEAALKIRDWDFQDVFGFSSIHYAADAKDPFFLDVIIRSNAPLTARSVEGYTALHHAVKNGCLANVEMLINVQPSLIDSIDRAHATPLHVAAIENRLDVANTLLLAGANPNCKTAMGMNPLMIAIYQGFENLALLMLDLQNIDLQHQLGDHSTALHLAVAKRMGFVVSFLIKQGCPVERSRQDGYTALHLAAELGWEEGVRLILSMVPYLDHEVKTREGKTAIELAIENHHRGVQEILQSSTRLNSAQPPSVNEPPKDDSYCSIF